MIHYVAGCGKHELLVEVAHAFGLLIRLIKLAASVLLMGLLLAGRVVG